MKDALYKPTEFEEKWRLWWDSQHTYKTVKDRPERKYVLVMFPYPSGSGLHVGHARVYTGTDVIARYFRMQGKSVLHPMGWDAFGLPAENAAIKQKKNPMGLVSANISVFKQQMRLLGISYDWDREFSTADPSYYKWTQWLFIQFFKTGLLYKKQTPIYYCPSCKTGLAQEEVLSEGTHERCGNKVEQRSLPQWIFRITKYADRLFSDLEGLDWPKGILDMQRNWINKREGIEMEFKIQNPKSKINKIKIFTTRPETVFGTAFVAVSPEKAYEWLSLGWRPKQDVIKYIDKSLKKINDIRQAQKDKTGVKTELKATNPATGDSIDVWIADYVTGDVGTGAIMGVPAHDERDEEFAKKFGLPVVHVELAGKDIISDLVNKRKAKKTVFYHLRDWIFSRQRYWGEPIPMIFCQKCADKKISYWNSSCNKTAQAISDMRHEGDQNNRNKYQNISRWQGEIEDKLYGWFPAKEADLPIELPKIESYEPTQTGESPLSKVNDWVKAVCPNCSGPGKRETDTMPNWAGSCWYFLYFARDLNSQDQNFLGSELESLDKLMTARSSITRASHGLTRRSLSQISTSGKNFDLFNKPNRQNWETIIGSPARDWIPVDWYIGGAEHAVLHLLYTRFWMKAMYDLRLVDSLEPFIKLRNIGMVIAKDSRKMSKSFGNTISPDDVVKTYGADTLRVCEMFIAPFSQKVVWSTQTLHGSHRFLTRIWQIYNSSANITNDSKQEDDGLVVELQRLVLKVSSDITNVKFNTAIAAMMKFINLWEEIPDKKLSDESAKSFLKLLAPFAPYMAEEIWHTVFGQASSIHLSSWPQVDKHLTRCSLVKIPIQINGKVRDIISVSAQALSQDLVIVSALSCDKVKKWIGTKPYRVIYKKGKIINFIIV